MTSPCESREDIAELQKHIALVSNNGNKLEEAILRLATSQERQVAEMREMTQTITAHMIDNREFRLTLQHDKEAKDFLFESVRKLKEDDIHLTALVHAQKIVTTELNSCLISLNETVKPMPLKIQKIELSYNRLMGGIVVIPGIFTALSFFVVLYSTFGEK